MEFEKRYNEQGQVAVLISPGFGAGWSTWAHDGEGQALLFDSRLVDAHVRRLRVKIEDQPDEPRLIVTVRGIGYRLMPVI